MKVFVSTTPNLAKKISRSGDIIADLPARIPVGGRVAGLVNLNERDISAAKPLFIELIKRERCSFPYQNYEMNGEDVRVIAHLLSSEPGFVLSVPPGSPPSSFFSREVYIEYVLRLKHGELERFQPVQIVDLHSTTSSCLIAARSKCVTESATLASCLVLNRQRRCTVTLKCETDTFVPPCGVDFVLSIGGTAKISKLTASLKYKCRVASTGTIQLVPARHTFTNVYSKTTFGRVWDGGTHETDLEVSLMFPAADSINRYPPATPSGTIIQGEYGIEVTVEYGCLFSEYSFWFPIHVV